MPRSWSIIGSRFLSIIGVIGSSGVITDERMRERFVYALRVMGTLIPAILETLDRIPPAPRAEEPKS